MKHETQPHPREILRAIMAAHPEPSPGTHTACPTHTAQPRSEVIEYPIPRTAYRHSSALPLFTLSQFAERNPAFTQAALRNLIFKADQRLSSKGVIPGNGLIEAGAVIRVGRKVLLNEERFLAWVEAQSGGSK